MAILKENPTLQDIQDYNMETMRERGFENETLLEQCLLLGEEVGELFQSVRKHAGIKVADTKELSSVEEEIADVLILLVSVANKLNIDLEGALRSKEEKNKKRKWI